MGNRETLASGTGGATAAEGAGGALLATGRGGGGCTAAA
jgi:hypothetical protein